MFTCETWLKKASELGLQILFLKFGVSLGAIQAHFEIGRGILDNLFGKPFAKSFQNAPWQTF